MEGSLVPANELLYQGRQVAQRQETTGGIVLGLNHRQRAVCRYGAVVLLCNLLFPPWMLLGVGHPGIRYGFVLTGPALPKIGWFAFCPRVCTPLLIGQTALIVGAMALLIIRSSRTDTFQETA